MSLLDDLANAEREHPTFVYVMAFVGALNGLLFGFDTGVISGALPFIKRTFELSTFLSEVTTASVLVGAMAGAMVGGRLADRFGRRRLTLAGATVSSSRRSEWRSRRRSCG